MSKDWHIFKSFIKSAQVPSNSALISSAYKFDSLRLLLLFDSLRLFDRLLFYILYFQNDFLT